MRDSSSSEKRFETRKTQIMVWILILLLFFADTPGPVGGLEATDVTKTTAQLSWSPPDNDGGSPITNYIVEKREVDRKTWTKCVEDLKKTSFKVTNMTPGIEYYFRVMACNKYGTGVPQDSPKSYLALDPISECQTTLIVCRSHPQTSEC